MDYFFERDGVKEAVALERWGWGVIYKDGTELHQFGEAGDFHQFREIVQEEVAMFVMYRTDDMSKRIDMPLQEGMKLVHFYTNVVLEAGLPSERRIRIYTFGWQDPRGADTFMYILPDDRIITTNHKIGSFASFAI